MFDPQSLEGNGLSENLKAWYTELMENTAFIPLHASGRIDHSLTVKEHGPASTKDGRISLFPLNEQQWEFSELSTLAHRIPMAPANYNGSFQDDWPFFRSLPLKDDEKILDAGTGNGQWALGVADMFLKG